MLKTMMLVECTYPGTYETKDGKNITYRTGEEYYFDPFSINFSGKYHCYVLVNIYNLKGEFLGITDATNFRTVEYIKNVEITIDNKEDK